MQGEVLLSRSPASGPAESAPGALAAGFPGFVVISKKEGKGSGQLSPHTATPGDLVPGAPLQELGTHLLQHHSCAGAVRHGRGGVSVHSEA